MKRGFLNGPQYKRAIDEAYTLTSPLGPKSPRQKKPGGGKKADATQDAMDVEMSAPKDGTEAEAPARARVPKGKGKEKAVDVDDDAMLLDTQPGDDDAHVSYIPPRPPPRPPGQGRHPEDEFFHTVPESHGGPHKKRAVFRCWPRDPNGQALVPSEKQRGTLSPDGYPWGATLYDFYHVSRIPGIPGLISIMTGSTLCEAMKELGELDAAEPEIEWAESEGRPRVQGAADTEELMKCMDTMLKLQGRLDLSPQSADRGKRQKVVLKKREDNGDATTIPITSPFHPSHYPKPWPFTPFENGFLVLLQEHIPLHLLPQILHVHDPFDLLTTREPRFRNTSWTSRPDVVRTYNLRLSGSVHSQVEEAKRKAKELEEFKARTLIILRYQRSKEQIKNNELVIEVPLPPYLRRPTGVEESHLYLSPIARIGQGHHSIVYKAEWELPREMFTKTEICRLCFKESVDKEVQRLKDTGRWEKILKAASWGPNGFTGRRPTKADLDAARDPINLERDGEIIERELTCVVPPDMVPSLVVKMIEEDDVWDKFMKERHLNAMQLHFVQDGDQVEKDSRVPVIRIDPPFTYENQKDCTHGANPFHGAVPCTAKFTVAAKLSLENDLHLAREASNYQEFPERLFHHYDGYTIISQLHSIVPVHAVVPQFYGYYTPKTEEEKDPGQPSYLSPILLLEHCGKPINPEELSDEDQEECASLVLRFQRAGWLHESIAPRNFLIQAGKPTEFPLTRQCKPEPSFRLIDFGRSRKYETAQEKREEEFEALRMFAKLQGSMGVTLSL